MGASCCCDSRNLQIRNYLTNAEEQDKRATKLVMIGPGSTGKSTLLQSLKMVHGEGHLTSQEKLSSVRLIWLNILDGISILVKQSNILYARNPQLYESCQFIADDNLNSQMITINKYMTQTMADVSEISLNESQLMELSQCVETIWNLPCIQETYHNRRNNFAISDNLEHFFNQIDTIFSKKYVPTEEDCLKNRSKTTGMNQYEYSDQDNKRGVTQGRKFVIFDVGGQRAERKKWINYFNDVNGMLFVASLIDFNSVLYEDSSMNSMLECVKLFSTMTMLQEFTNCAIILILNKNDLLEQLLKTSKDNGLAKCFSKEGKWPNEDEYWDPLIDEQYFPHIFNNNNNVNGDINIDENMFNEYHRTVVLFIKQIFINANQHTNNIYNKYNNNNKKNGNNHKMADSITNDTLTSNNDNNNIVSHNNNSGNKEVSAEIDEKFHCHVTCALETDLVGKLFQTIQVSLVSDNLSELGMKDFPAPEQAAFETKKKKSQNNEKKNKKQNKKQKQQTLNNGINGINGISGMNNNNVGIKVASATASRRESMQSDGTQDHSAIPPNEDFSINIENDRMA